MFEEACKSEDGIEIVVDYMSFIIVITCIANSQISANKKVFRDECQELSLPVETFDYDRAYRLAATEWRIELMLAVVEKIIKWYDDDVPLEATELAVWDVAKQEIVVDRTVC